MADKNIYWSKTALTGGAAGALDSIDGTGLQDGEVAHVWVSGVLYVYLLDVDSAAGESSPTIISPDANAGDKRWILQSVSGYAKPSFLAVPASTQENIVAGGAVTIVWGTEVYDIGGGFAANTFTAPVTGKYQFNVVVYLLNLDTAASLYSVTLVTTAKSYPYNFSPNLFSADVPYWTVAFGVTAAMSATDTAYVTIEQTGGGNQKASIHRAGFPGSWSDDVSKSVHRCHKKGLRNHPQALVLLYHSGSRALSRRIFSHNGTLDKHIGDSIMGIFGAPVGSEDAAYRALEAALAIRDEMLVINKGISEEEKKIAIGIGIATGDVMAGIFGSTRKKEYTVLGSPVNLASRLENLAQANEILICSETARLVEDRMNLEKVPSPIIRGLDKPPDLFRVLGKK